MDQSIVRPYAVALFESAEKNQTFEQWDTILTVLTETASLPAMKDMIESPAVSPEDVRKMFELCCSDIIGKEGVRLLEILQEHNRFVIIPELADTYKAMYSQQRGVKNATIVSAIELEDTQQLQIVQRLEKKCNSVLAVTWGIDTELIGGLHITVDDTVIDASVRGRLSQMASALKM